MISVRWARQNQLFTCKLKKVRGFVHWSAGQMVRRSDGPLAVNVNPNSGMQSPRESSGGCCTGVHAHTHACAHTHTNMRSIRNYWSCAGLIDFSRVHATLKPLCWSACRLVHGRSDGPSFADCGFQSVLESRYMRVVMCWSQCLGVAKHERCQGRVSHSIDVAKR